MTRITLFLASSIVELSEIREQLEGYIYNIGDRLQEKYDVSLVPLLCEQMDTAMQPNGLQSAYDSEIEGSDFVLFLFYKKAGAYTLHELEVAHRAFLQKGSPKIYVFFLNDAQQFSFSQDVQDCMHLLAEKYQHYYEVVSHIDAVKYRIVLALREQIASLKRLDISTVGESVLLDGKPLSGVSLENIPEFFNNKTLRRFKQQLSDVEARYFALAYNGNLSEEQAKELVDLNAQRKTYKEIVQNQIQQIFKLSRRMCEDVSHGTVTERQKRAYEAFSLGDIERANAILDRNEIRSDYQARMALLKREAQEETQVYIQILRQKAKILQAMRYSPLRSYDYAMAYADEEDSFVPPCDGDSSLDEPAVYLRVMQKKEDEILSCYTEAAELAERFEVQRDVFFEAAEYLYDKGDRAEALEWAKRTEEIYEYSSVDAEELLALYTLFGKLYAFDIKTHRMVEVYRQKAALLGEKAEESYWQSVLLHLANCLEDLARELESREEYAEANKLLRSSRALYMQVKEANSYWIEYLNYQIASNQLWQGQFEEALSALQRAVESKYEEYSLAYLDFASACYDSYQKLQKEIPYGTYRVQCAAGTWDYLDVVKDVLKESYMRLSYCYASLGNGEKDVAVLLEYLSLLELFPNWGCMGVICYLKDAYEEVAETYRRQGKMQLAIDYERKAVWAMEEVFLEDEDEDELIECYQRLSELCEEDGNEELCAFCEKRIEALEEGSYLFDESGRAHFIGCLTAMREKCEQIFMEKGRMYLHGVVDTLLLTARYHEKWGKKVDAEGCRKMAEEFRRKNSVENR
ncbi:MAG: hypothetical protein IJF71_03855 [Clostridia bacterium]|nr:hypothetical protein [Clostridia bacterium]